MIDLKITPTLEILCTARAQGLKSPHSVSNFQRNAAEAGSFCGIFCCVAGSFRERLVFAERTAKAKQDYVTSYLPSVSYVKNTVANADLETGTGKVREFALPLIQ